MSTKQATADYIVDQLASLRNVRVRKMFGEYALYCDDKVVGLICDDELYIKKTEPGEKAIEGRFKMAPPYHGAKLHMQVSENVLDNREQLSELIRLTANLIPVPKPKPIKKPISNQKQAPLRRNYGK